MRLLERLSGSTEPADISALSAELHCDERTIRRDVDLLQRLLSGVSAIEMRRSRVTVTRSGFSPGYFTEQLERQTDAKLAIAHCVLSMLSDGLAVALTAGSTTRSVACEIRRAAVEGAPPHNLIVFTNSVPSLLELIAAGITTGVLGEIYSPDDCAFHSPEFRSAFQPNVAIVGASGVLFGTGTNHGTLDLFSSRAEEAAFLKQLLGPVPEVIVAVDHTKLGRHHPWSFGGQVLAGKRVTLVTDVLTSAQREILGELSVRMAGTGSVLSVRAACDAEAETV